MSDDLVSAVYLTLHNERAPGKHSMWADQTLSPGNQYFRRFNDAMGLPDSMKFPPAAQPLNRLSAIGLVALLVSSLIAMVMS